MAKVRIYALAKELGLTNDEMLRELLRTGLTADSALGSIESDIAEQLRGDRAQSSVKITRVEEKTPKKRVTRKKSDEEDGSSPTSKPAAMAKPRAKAKGKTTAKSKVTPKAKPIAKPRQKLKVESPTATA